MANEALRRMEYAALRAAEGVLCRLSWENRVRVGRVFGRGWYLADARHRAVARGNVARAYPEWSRRQVLRVVRANFEHLGVVGAEFLGLGGVTAEELLARYRFEGLEHLDEARGRGRGVLCLTGHLGNWELASPVLAVKGYPMNAVARKLGNHHVDRHVTALRARFGSGLIPHRDATRRILRELRAGKLVAFLMDQKPLAREAISSEFFGQRVATNQGLALLALKSGAPVVAGFDEREEGGRHVIRIQSALSPPVAGTLEMRVRSFTEAFDSVIEAAVRRRPEQWFWVHRRWRLPGDMDR